MFRRIVTFVLVVFILNLTFYSTVAANGEKEVKFAQKIRTNVEKLGDGENAKVKVKLMDGTTLKGYISETDPQGFKLVDKYGTSVDVPYLQVKQVKGNNLSTGAKVAIVFGLLLIPAIVVAVRGI